MMMRYCEGKAIEGRFMGLEMGATLSGVALYERCGYTRSGKVDIVKYVGRGRVRCSVVLMRAGVQMGRVSG
jgi:hypothetical protein